MWLCAKACILMCASERVCSLFMAKNKLSLAHNGNVNSPEHFCPTQGESWLGECCVFPNPNKEKQVDGLKNPAPIFFPSLQHCATPCPYITQTGQPNKSYRQPDNVFTHAMHKVQHPHTRLWVQWVGDVAHIMTDDIFYMGSLAKQPINVMLNLT